VTADRRDHELSLLVEDHGPGIPPDALDDIFDRFTRGATTSAEGAGLGLAIAQSYARAHGGNITYQPAYPHGARFLITLPTSPASV
jgi:signal transduction histidine kinase